MKHERVRHNTNRQLNLEDLWKMMEYTSGDYSNQQHKFLFPLPTPILRCTKEVSVQTAMGAKGE